MEKRKNLKNKIRILLLILTVAAISFDFITSESDAESGTYRFESDFDAVTSATTKVAIVPSDYSGLASPVSRSSTLTYDQVEAMVRKAIELQGGLDWVISKGDNVLIKVNLVGANSPSGQGENTDVRVVKALIKIINDFTAGDVTIVVAEGSARTNDDPTSSSSVWANSGYTDLLSDSILSGVKLSLVNLNQTIDDLVEVDLGNKGTCAPMGTKYHVHRAELEADVFIDVPVLKIHDTGITNALKLQIGTAPGCYYGYNKESGTTYSAGIYHDVDQRRWTTESIVDLSAIADIDFVVVDALMCLETKKTYATTNQVRMNTIVAGVDPVAVDHVCAQLFCLNPDDIDYVTLAEKIGLGTNDPDKILVVGAAVDDVKKQVKKNTAENGKFGQSNRTWILSQAYEGTSIATEYIANEATLKPTPGADGWSQPVYFFDDRIDLLSYYNSAKNIVTYAFTYFDAPATQEAELWLGRQEAIYVYINGVLAYSSATTQTYSDSDVGEKVATINIKEGENTLLVKTLNLYGDYSFALNICDVESNTLYAGNRVTGLKFYEADGTSSSDRLSNKKHSCFQVYTYPNPATDHASICFTTTQEEKVLVQVLNLKGELVKTLQNGTLEQGTHEISWDLSSLKGNHVPPGIYLCKVKAGSKQNSNKIEVK